MERGARRNSRIRKLGIWVCAPLLSPFYAPRSWRVFAFTQRFSGNPRPHSAAVTSRASYQCGFAIQSRNFRRLARVSFAAPRSNSVAVIPASGQGPQTTALNSGVCPPKPSPSTAARALTSAPCASNQSKISRSRKSIARCSSVPPSIGVQCMPATMVRAAALRWIDFAQRKPAFDQLRIAAKVFLQFAKCLRDETPSSAYRAGRSRIAQRFRESRVFRRDSWRRFPAPRRAERDDRRVRP